MAADDTFVAFRALAETLARGTFVAGIFVAGTFVAGTFVAGTLERGATPLVRDNAVGPGTAGVLARAFRTGAFGRRFVGR